jgi:anti-sigma regulatory factor (Ser/Thr protein kinase)
MDGASHLSFVVPAEPRALPMIRGAVRGWLSLLGVERMAAADIVVATWEVCANAIEHPVDRATRELVVEAEAEPGCVRVSVVDSGRWRPPGRSGPSRGLGLTIVSGLMDDVLVERRGRGTEVRMVRNVATTV